MASRLPGLPKEFFTREELLALINRCRRLTEHTYGDLDACVRRLMRAAMNLEDYIATVGGDGEREYLFPSR